MGLLYLCTYILVCLVIKCNMKQIPLYVSREARIFPSIKYFLFTPFVSNGNESSIDYLQVDRFPANVQTGPGAHPVSCTMGTVSFPGGKATETWRWPPPLTHLAPRLMKDKSYTCTTPPPPVPSWQAIGRPLPLRFYTSSPALIGSLLMPLLFFSEGYSYN